MNRDEGLRTKLWLEGYENRTAARKKQRQHNLKKFKINSKSILQIKTFIKKNNISWEALISSAWGYLLNRFSSSDSISFGIGTIIAKTTNTLKIASSVKPITSIINEKISIKTFINKTQLQLNKKYAEKSIPNQLRYLLLFDAKEKRKQFDMVSIDHYPLNLLVTKKIPNNISFFYNSNIFSTESLQIIFEHLEIILLGLCNTPLQKKIIKINLLTEFETKMILQEWKAPEYDFRIPKLNGCLIDLFNEQVQKNPTAIAINYNDLNKTYKELDETSTLLAKQLIEKEVTPGQNVSVLMERTPSLIMAMLAIFKCGAVYVPINPKYPHERIEYVLSDCQAKFILVDQIDKLPEKYQTKGMIIDDNWENLKNNANKNKVSLPEVNSEQIAYIIYTSGTTGQPKGVTIKHKSLVNLIAWYRGCFEVGKYDRASQFASQGFDTYLCEVAPFIASGASVHIVDDNIKLTPSLLFEWLKKQKITICDLPTSYAQMIFLLPWPKNMSLRLVKIGGENATHYPTQMFPFDIWNGYGPTETTIEATFIKLCSANTAYHTVVRHYPPPIGRPIANTEIFVVDKYLQPVPMGITGELLIGGIGVSAGYLNRPDLTNERFIPHIIEKNNPNKLYRTGDLVRWLPDGNLEFIDRIDHQVKIRGYRIELGDIESVISQYPDVNEVVVLVRESANKEKSMVAYIAPNLNKKRYLYQERCLLSLSNNTFIETVTEDISKGGISLSGVTEQLNIGEKIQFRLKLPGLASSKQFVGVIIWQQNERCGIAFDVNDEDKTIIEKSIEYYLSTHNMMDLILSASSKRNLRKALRNKIPEYMIPTAFVTLLQFPLTFSGKIDKAALPPPEEFEQIVKNEYIAPKTEMEKNISKIWCEILGKKNISMSDNFFDLGGSSLTAARLSVEILQKFKSAIPAKILFDLPYIPILAEYIDTKGQNYTQYSNIQEEINRDCKLDETIFSTKKLSPSIKDPENILLTGAGGFLGVYFLKELLQHTKAKIYCLVRRGEFESPVKKLMANITKYNLEQDIPISDRRLIIIAGDISFHHFGLPLQQYNSLVEKIDIIYHCGAQVNIMASYNKLRGSNVQGTLEIIKFATTHVDKPIHYISTLSSATRKDDLGNLSEEFPADNYEDLFGGYALSKWASEKLLLEIKKRGLPVTIYRSGYIAGQSTTGITNLNDALLMLVKGCIQLGYAPNLEEKITILPVDFVAKAIVQISLAVPAESNVYHIDHPTGILWTDLVAWLNDYGYKIKIIPLKKWQEMLADVSPENALFPFLPHYLSLQEQRTPGVSVTKATAILKKCKLDYPKIDNNLLSIYFDYLCRVNFLPLPQEKMEVSS